MPGAREKALRFLREVPRLSINNVKVRNFTKILQIFQVLFKGLPQVVGIDPACKKKRGRGNTGHDHGEM